VTDDAARLLEGNGAPLVRERALARAVQRALERLYQLEGSPPVCGFVTAAPHGERETLLVREGEDGSLELALRLPALAKREFHVEAADLDPLCQLIEGVSHFVYLTDRAAADRGTTQLELEVQAEVDKYVVLASSMGATEARASARLRERLYEDVRFLHGDDTEHGERYRVANAVAARFTAHLERKYLARGHWPAMRAELRRFFRLGQEAKLRAA